MTITGTGFSSSSIVTINNRFCINPIVLNFSRITCTVPDSNVTTTTSVSVFVTSDQSTVMAPVPFIYDTTNVPSILLYQPTVFSLSGGLLNMTGNQFGLGLATVIIGNTYATVQHTSPTQILAVLPPLAPGFYSMSVFTANGNYARPRLTIEYRFTVQTMSPRTGSLYGGTDVHIEGEGFDATTTVSFMKNSTSIPCPIVSYQSNEINCQTISAIGGIHFIRSIGFDWSPAYLVVEQGAIVQWQWGSSSLLNQLLYKVQQIPAGFDSGNATSQGMILESFFPSLEEI